MDPQVNHIEFLSQKRWQTHYPKKEAQGIQRNLEQEKIKKVSNNYLHFLIANDSFNAKVKISKEALLYKDPNFSFLTPLHIAAMKGNQLAVEFLLKTAKELLPETVYNNYLNAPDKQGWTALHFAAVTSDEILKILIKDPKVNAKAETVLGGTFGHLRRFVGKPLTQFSKEHVILKIKGFENKLLSKCSQDELKSLRFEYYTDIPFYKDPETLELLWGEGCLSSDPVLNKLGNEIFKNLQSHPPLLSVEECPEINGLKLVAQSLIKKGAAVGSYGGCVKQTDNYKDDFSEILTSKTSPYLFDNIDPIDGGNAIRYANKGRPNTVMVGIVINGANINLLLAIEDIKPGDEILWDYSLSVFTLNFSEHMVFDRNKVRQDFSQEIADIYSRFLEAKKIYDADVSTNMTKMEKFLDFIHLESILLFPMNTPLIPIDLHFSNVVHINKWITLFAEITKDAYYKKDLYLIKKVAANMVGYSAVYSVMKRIQAFDHFMKDFSEQKIFIYDWFVKCTDKLSVMQILQVMEILKKENLKTVDINALLEQVLKQVDDYDWLKDPHAALSYENRKNDFVEFQKLFLPRDVKQALYCLNTSLQHSILNTPDFEEGESCKLMRYTISQLKKESASN